MDLQFELSRIFDGDGISISITGMLIVFAGLALTSSFIFSLPRGLVAWDRFWARKKPSGNSAASAKRAAAEPSELPEGVVIAAIALVLENELRSPDGSDLQRITLRRSPENSIWGRAGRMRHLTATFTPPRRTP